MPSPTAVVTSPPLIRRFAGAVLLVTVLLIGYGSLFPFEFVARGRSLGDLLLGLSFRPTTRGDIVANLLLYLPLGAGLVLVLVERFGRVAALLGAVAGGSLLSVGIEVVQVHVPGRDSSLTDVVLNAIGTLVGASAAIVYARSAATPRKASVSRGSVDAVAIGVVLLWLGNRLAPFVPTVDWQKYKDAIRPLLVDVQVSALSVLGYTVAWLVVDYALCRSGKLANPRAGFLLAVAIVLAGRVVVVNTALSPAELVAIALCLPLAIGITALGGRRQPGTLLALVVLATVLQGLEPFTPSVMRASFGWVPFQSSITGSFELGYSVLFEKVFWYTSLIWLGLRAGWPLVPAAFATAALLAALEIAQMWLPGRSPEITDPLLALVVAALVGLLAGRRDAWLRR